MKTTKSRVLTLFGIALLAAAMTFLFTACPPEPEPEGVDIPAELVAKWYTTQALADAGTGTATFEFTSEGKLLYLGVDNKLTITVENKVITNYRSGSKVGTVKYAISGTAINFSETTGEQVLSTLLTFYKKAGQTVPEYRSVIWNLNGGTASAWHPTQIVKGTVLAKPSPNPKKADSLFGGWYTDSALTQMYNFDNPVTDDLNLYAKWEPIGPLAVELARLLNESNVENGQEYTINVNADETMYPYALTYANRNGITIKLIGTGTEKVVSLSENGSLFTVENSVTLVLGDNITLQGRNDNNDSLVRVNSGGTLIMENGAKITNNKGGGVYNNGTFTMNGGEISGNSDSGVIVCGDNWGSGTFTMNGGEISGNSDSGVIVYGDNWDSGTFTMNGGEISGNTSDGVYVSGGTFTMENGKISAHNYAGVYVGVGIFTMKNGIIISNDCGVKVYGGNWDGGTFIMNGGKISGNTASDFNGNGVSVGAHGTFTMNGGEISGNSDSGVIVYGDNWDGGTFTMNGGKISGNTASDSGGGVSVGAKGTFTMNDGEISNNTSSFGGGVCVRGGSTNYPGTFTMNDGEISGNTASSNGGGVYVTDGTFAMNGGKISGNTASYNGGGVYAFSYGTFTMKDGEISGNTASNDGGGVHVWGIDARVGHFTMYAGTISGNTASNGGGVYVNYLINGAQPTMFTMSGGTISGNIASSSGGGVYVYQNGGVFIFSKSGGTIYGYSASDTINSNVVKNNGVVVNNQGHAVYVYVNSSTNHCRETTAESGVNLDAGDWEN